MPTITQVAERAGVSTATVSNVIRNTRTVSTALRERVEAAIRDLDYSPNEIARSLKVRQTRILACVLPDITNPFFPEIIRGAEDTAFDRGYFLVTANTDQQVGRERRILSALRSYRVDGILLAPGPEKDTSHIQHTLQCGIFIVCLDRPVFGIATDAVLLDNVKGARECVRHMIQSGYSRIAIITGRLTLQTGIERLRGYEEALREADIPIEKDLILEGDFHEESGYQLGKTLLQRQVKPTAIFVCNGLMTLGLLRALEETGVRCPDDLAVATFDDLAMKHSFHPRLTAVVQPVYEMGARAATILIDRIEGKLTAERMTVQIVPTLVVRESTQPRPIPPAAQRKPQHGNKPKNPRQA